MSRTYRCKNETAPGWEVRDGGDWFYPECCPNKKAVWERSNCSCWHDRLNHKVVYYRPYHKEKGWFRKQHYRKHRAQVRNAMCHERWEEIPRYRRTSGWLTW